mgnify:CR=1 FL=1
MAVVTVLFCLGSSAAVALSDQESQVKGLAFYTMGVIADLQGQAEDAIDYYKTSLEYQDVMPVHLRLGADYARLGRLPEAVTELQRVIREDPAHVQARYLLALIYTSQKDFGKAAQEYETILTSFSKADPKNIEIYGYLAQLYYSQKQYDKAIKQFEIILSLNPTDNADLVYLLGSLYLEVENKEKAIDLFLRALKINPNHDGSLNSLGYIYAEDGTRLDEAQTMVERALKADPQNGAYLDSLAWVYYKKGEYQKALDYLIEADNYMKDPIIYEHMGDVYSQLGQKDNAKKYWDLSLKLLPDQDHVIQKIKSLGSLSSSSHAESHPQVSR